MRSVLIRCSKREGIGVITSEREERAVTDHEAHSKACTSKLFLTSRCRTVLVVEAPEEGEEEE